MERCIVRKQLITNHNPHHEVVAHSITNVEVQGLEGQAQLCNIIMSPRNMTSMAIPLTTRQHPNVPKPL